MPEPRRRSIAQELNRRGPAVVDLRTIKPTPVRPAPRKVEMRDVHRYGLALKPEVAKEKPVAVPKPPAAPKPVASTAPNPAARSKWVNYAQYPLIALVAMAASYSSTAGQWFVALYALYAFVRRVDSRVSFGAALFILVTVPFFQALGQSGIAQNAAIYVYELLVIGTVQAVIELRKSGTVTD